MLHSRVQSNNSTAVTSLIDGHGRRGAREDAYIININALVALPLSLCIILPHPFASWHLLSTLVISSLTIDMATLNSQQRLDMLRQQREGLIRAMPLIRDVYGQLVAYLGLQRDGPNGQYYGWGEVEALLLWGSHA